MIKIILTFTLILLFVPSIVKAQLQLGVKAGMNVSNAEVKDFVNWLVTDYKPSVGINFGVFAKIKMTSKFFLIPEVLYSQRGYIRPPSIFDPPRSTDIVINCLESPVLISYFPMKFMAIEIGPNMAVKLFTYNRTAKVSMRDEFYKFDFGISGGLRFNIMDNWSVMSRYYYGITPIYEIDTIVRGQYPAKGSMYSRNFQVSIAYTFQFKAKE